MKRRGEYITARIPAEIKEAIEKIALEERRSKSQVLMMLVESALAARNGKKKN